MARSSSKTRTRRSVGVSGEKDLQRNERRNTFRVTKPSKCTSFDIVEIEEGFRGRERGTVTDGESDTETERENASPGGSRGRENVWVVGFGVISIICLLLVGLFRSSHESMILT